MVKYEIGSFSGDLITRVDVIKETEKQLVLTKKDTWDKPYQFRVSKRSSFRQYFDTWEEAYDYLLAQSNDRVELAEKNLARAKDMVRQVEGLKK